MKGKVPTEPGKKPARPPKPAAPARDSAPPPSAPPPAAPPAPEPSRETVVLHFNATIKKDPRGRFTARADGFPDVVAHGDTEEEAQSGLQAAILKSLAASSAVALEPVYEEPLGFTPYALLSHGDRLMAATNLDVVVVSETGNRDAWKRVPVTQQPSEYFQVFEGEEPEEILEPGEYLTQVYCLAPFAPPGGTEGVYAGTNLKGLVFVTEQEGEWRPAFNTDEERVHSLAAFQGLLYAGTSPRGRIFRWDGRASEMVHQARELGITALAAHGNAIYAGTYPEGLILRSEDGEAWEIVCQTGQRFVNQLLPAKEGLYAACSHPAGGAVYRTIDGKLWEKCFTSERDVNVFSLAYFGGRLYAGTGDEGRLYSSRDGVRWELTAVSPEAAVRVLAVHRGRLVVGTEHRGMIYRTTATETPPPRIADVKVTALSSSAAIVEWSTDSPCDAILQYGAGQVRDQTVTNPNLSKRHRIRLDGLKAGTRYTFLIRARNADGGQVVHLADEGFVTQVLPVPVITVPTHPEEDRWYPSRQVRLAWEPVQGASRYLVRFAKTRVTALSADDQQTKDNSFTALVPSDGVWWFGVAGVDEAGNVGDLMTRAVRVDATSRVPVAACLSHPDPERWYSHSVVEIEADGEDENSGVDCFMYSVGRPGESWEHLAFQRAPAPRWSLPRLPDGTWDIYIRLRDNAGNESPPAALRVRTDTAPPEVALAPLPRVARAGEFEVSWKATDERSGLAKVSLQQKREGGEWTSVYEGTGQSARIPAEDGSRILFRVVAEDGAGVRAIAEAHEPVLFDGSPPPPITSLQARSMPGGDILLKWAPVTDALSETFQYHVYRSGEEGRLGIRVGTVPANVQEFADDGTGLAHGGRYFYRVAGEDVLGNVQDEGQTVECTCDKEAPVPILRSPTHPPEGWTEKTEAVVEWSEIEDHTGIVEYLWRLDRNPASTLTRGVDTIVAGPPLKLSRLLDGLWYVHVSSVDGAGNVSPPAHYPLRIVTKVLTARIKPLPAVHNSRKILVEWEGDEGVAAVSVGIREGGAQEWKVLVERAEGRQHEVTMEREGLFEFSVRPQDSYGRWGVWEAGQVTLIDATPPLEITEIRAESKAMGAIKVEWEPSWDELSGLSRYRLMRSKDPKVPGEVVAEVAATEDCEYLDACEGVPEGTRFVYRVWPVDSAGNVLEKGPTAAGVCDRSAPTPRLASRSHPDPARPYNSRRLEVLWDAEDPYSGVAGVVVELNAVAGTIPNPETLALKTERSLQFDLPGDGKWYLHVRTVDNAGNAGEAAHLPVFVDTVVDPPLVSLVQDPFLEWQQNGEVTVSLKAPDDLSGVPCFWYVLNQARETVPEKLTAVRHTADTLKVKPPAEGMWYLHVVAEDAAGNVSSPVHIGMRLTSGLPMPRIVSCSHPEGMWSHSRELAMEWERIEGERVSYMYWVARERADTPPASAIRVTDAGCRLTLEEGEVFLHVCAADELGRRSAVMAYQVRVDGTPPSIILNSITHKPGEWSVKRRVQYSVAADDAHSGIARVELALTAAGEEPAAWELALGTEGEREVPGEGLWTLWARSFDQAGNGSSTVRLDLLVDLMAPPPIVCSQTNPEGMWSSSREVELDLQSGEDLSGIAGYLIYVVRLGEDVPFFPPDDAVRFGEETGRVVLPEDGRWTAVVWSEDLAGNMSQHTRYPIAVDSSARMPAGFTIEPSGEGGWIRSNELRVTWRVPDEVSGEPLGYLWALDESADTEPPEDAGFTPVPEIEFGEIEDGIRFLHVATVDAAGNVSPAAHMRLPVDSLPPQLRLECAEAEAGRWIRNKQVTIAARAEDGVSGVHGFFFTLHKEGNEAPAILEGSWREDTSWAVAIPGDGTWIISVAAMDGAGNVSEVETATVRVDSEAHPPMEMRSPSHPDPSHWYPGRAVKVAWKRPPEAAGIACYRWKLASQTSELGDPADWATVKVEELKTEVSRDGHWLFAVATEDGAGNRSDAVMCEVRVDSTAPRPVLSLPSHPDPASWYAEGNVTVEVSAEDTASGVAHILVGAAQGSAAPKAMEEVGGVRTVLALAPGSWTVHAVAQDGAGNRSEPATAKVMIDPAVRPPLVACESHPDPDRWYPNSSLRFSVVAAGADTGRQFWVELDDKPDTRPARNRAKAVGAGKFDLSAPGSGEWYLHLVTSSRDNSLSGEVVHVRARVDMLAPHAPVVRSSTHPRAPRRASSREFKVEWDEPADLSGIAGYDFALFRSGVIGMHREKADRTAERKMEFAGLAPGFWDFSVAARDRAGNTGPPGKYSVLITDTQDLCVSVKSESWRVWQVGMDVELRQEDRLFRKGRTGPNGEVWFRDLVPGNYGIVVGMEKLSPPISFDGIRVDEGEAHIQFEVSLAGAAWTLCRDALRLFVKGHWLEGGRVEVLDMKEVKVAEHKFMGMDRRGTFIECNLPENLLEGYIHLLGGALNKLQWPPLKFIRLP